MVAAKGPIKGKLGIFGSPRPNQSKTELKHPVASWLQLRAPLNYTSNI